MEEIKVKQFEKVITGPDRVRILKDEKVIWSGWGSGIPEEYFEETIKKFRAVPEIRHKQWKDRDLMPPMEPEILAQYSFSDLEMKLYYDIHI